MLARLNDPDPVSKTFYSERLIVKLTFHEKGGLDGQIYPFTSCQEISSEITGLYIRHGDNIQLGFAGCLRPDHSSFPSSMYTGEILRYHLNKECLIIKWVTMSIDNDAAHSDIEVLLDSDCPDLILETIKIREYVNSYEVIMS